MKLLASVCVIFANLCSLNAQSKPPIPMPGLGQHRHAISTKNAEAQRFFDQRLVLVFGSTTKRLLVRSGERQS
jgi:hypothetical protein